ncbi:MAG: hypothetical protein V1758_09590 [Pseudomonadota bacterium]
MEGGMSSAERDLRLDNEKEVAHHKYELPLLRQTGTPNPASRDFQGGKSFIKNVKALLGFRAKGRDVIGGSEGYQLREGPGHYKALFGAENDDIGSENTYFWDVNNE